VAAVRRLEERVQSAGRQTGQRFCEGEIDQPQLSKAAHRAKVVAWKEALSDPVRPSR
jgi:hypothetical protein